MVEYCLSPKTGLVTKNGPDGEKKGVVAKKGVVVLKKWQRWEKSNSVEKQVVSKKRTVVHLFCPKNRLVAKNRYGSIVLKNRRYQKNGSGASFQP